MRSPKIVAHVLQQRARDFEHNVHSTPRMCAPSISRQESVAGTPFHDGVHHFRSTAYCSVQF